MPGAAQADEGRPSGRRASASARLYVVLVVIAAVALLAAAGLSPPEWRYDEEFHMPMARSFAERQSVREFLLTPSDSAAGPLYAAVHAALARATGFSIVPHRVVNALLLVATVVLQAWVVRRLAPDRSAAVAGMYFAIPVVWPIGVMALTEVPAIFAATVSLALLVAVEDRGKPGRRLLDGWLSGLAAGCAILGRQSYLPLIVMPPAIDGRARGWLARTVAFLAAALPLPLAVFAVWGGMVPPSTRHAGGGIVPFHGMLAFAYVAIIMAIVAPRWYAGTWRAGAAAAAIAGVAAFAMGFEWRALDHLSRRLPESLQPYYTRILGMLLAGLTAWFLLSCVWNAVTRRDDRTFVGCVILMCLLTATSFGVVHLFSSRYVAIALPFVILAARPYFRPSWFACGRFAAGAAVGFMSMWTYVYR